MTTAADAEETISLTKVALASHGIPLSRLSQFLPEQYKRLRQGGLKSTPSAIIRDKIAGVLDDSAGACGYASD